MTEISVNKGITELLFLVLGLLLYTCEVYQYGWYKHFSDNIEP